MDKSDTNYFKVIEQIKRTKTPAQLCWNKSLMPLIPFGVMVYRLKFKEKPNYAHLRHILLSILLDKNMTPDIVMDWNAHER